MTSQNIKVNHITSESSFEAYIVELGLMMVAAPAVIQVKNNSPRDSSAVALKALPGVWNTFGIVEPECSAAFREPRNVALLLTHKDHSLTTPELEGFTPLRNSAIDAFSGMVEVTANPQRAEDGAEVVDAPVDAGMQSFNYMFSLLGGRSGVESQTRSVLSMSQESACLIASTHSGSIEKVRVYQRLDEATGLVCALAVLLDPHVSAV